MEDEGVGLGGGSGGRAQGEKRERQRGCHDDDDAGGRSSHCNRGSRTSARLSRAAASYPRQTCRRSRIASRVHRRLGCAMTSAGVSAEAAPPPAAAATLPFAQVSAAELGALSHHCHHGRSTAQPPSAFVFSWTSSCKCTQRMQCKQRGDSRFELLRRLNLSILHWQGLRRWRRLTCF